jgi:hypothetical protein
MGSDLFSKPIYVDIQKLAEVGPYVDIHKAELQEQNPLKTEKWLVEDHNRTFINWFAKKVRSQAP